MKKVYITLIWLMVLMCGSCAVTEVLTGGGSAAGLLFVLAGLSIIIYITLLPEKIKGDH